MKVTYNWLKDFVEIKIAPQALADKLTMAGLEVTSLEEKDGDIIFEIEVTSNRPDWLSVVGIAREAAAIINAKVKTQNAKLKLKTQNEKTTLKINIENKKDCPLYTAKIIKDVKVGPSPDWLKKRLELIGCRSVNNVVDITNYILFTFGEPLHAFNLDKLRSDIIIVRRGKKDEKITTIDDLQRILNPEILVIADRERPVAIAGIMGGKDTEVTESTKNVLLEAAIFNPLIIRRGRQKLGIQTESSYRFERGIDLETAECAAWQAVKLIQDIAGGKCVLAKSAGLTKIKKKAINLDVSTVSKILGVDIPASKVKSILNNLGFKLKSQTKNNFLVGIPSYRQDINLEIDLIEEIARDFGYEYIPTTIPPVIPQISSCDTKDLPRSSLKSNIALKEGRGLISLIKNILVGLGLNEVITYSLIDKDLLKGTDTNQSKILEILNPLSKDEAVLRPTIIPSIAKCIAYNLNQKQEYINVFEVAKIFSESGGSIPKEEFILGVSVCGIKSWLLEAGRIKEEVGLLHLKGILELLLERLGIKDYNFKMSPDNLEASVSIAKEKIGVMLSLSKSILDNLDIKNKPVFVAEIYLERLLKYADLKKKFIGLPKYPGIVRDISLVIKEEILAEEILKAIKEKAGTLLREAKIVDYYKGKQIPAGFRGLTISCVYRSDERTLTEEEINPAHLLVSNFLREKLGAQIR